jgi:hypothetical protein
MTIEPKLKDSQILLLGSGMHNGHDRIRRFVVDKASGTYFGYDLLVQPLAGKIRVSIEPLSTGPEGEHWIPRDMVLRPAPLPKYPPAQVLEPGDSLAIDLLVSPDGRQKVVEYLEFDTAGHAFGAGGEPRDFTFDDGPLAIHLQPLRVYINGAAFQGRTSMTTGRGGTLWFAFPGRGRYILSLAPHEGFQKTGAVRTNVLTFESEGMKYEVRCAGAIAGAGGSWNLYVAHDPFYIPPVAAGPTVFGGVDRLENLLPQR